MLYVSTTPTSVFEALSHPPYCADLSPCDIHLFPVWKDTSVGSTSRMTVCVCLCMYVCMYVFMYVYMYICICVCVCVCVYICMYVSLSLCVCVYVYWCIYLCVSLFLSLSLSLSLRLCVGRKEMFYLTTHSTHFIFTVIWRQTYG